MLDGLTVEVGIVVRVGVKINDAVGVCVNV